MTNTHSQDLEAHLNTFSSNFNTLSSNFEETQQEVRKLSSQMGNLKQEISTQLESFIANIYNKLNIPIDLKSYDQPFHPEGETSSHSHNFQSPPFQWELCLPQVDVNKFDGSDPTNWITQLEHYLFFYEITDELAKIRYGVLHLYQER
jgi:hypothetical protein